MYKGLRKYNSTAYEVDIVITNYKNGEKVGENVKHWIFKDTNSG